jgi:hypothetical protein
MGGKSFGVTVTRTVRGALPNAYYIPKHDIMLYMGTEKNKFMHGQDNNERVLVSGWKLVKWASTLLQRPARRQRE